MRYSLFVFVYMAAGVRSAMAAGVGDPPPKYLESPAPANLQAKTIESAPLAVAFQPDGVKAVVLYHRSYAVWDTATWTSASHNLRTGLDDAALSPDGKTLAVGSPGLAAKNERKAQIELLTPGEKRPRTLISVSPDGLGRHNNSGSNLVFSANGSRLSQTILEKTVIVYDVANGNASRTIAGKYKAAVPSGDGKLVLVNLSDRTNENQWELISLTAGKPLASFEAVGRPALSHDSQKILTVELVKTAGAAKVNDPKKPPAPVVKNPKEPVAVAVGPTYTFTVRDAQGKARTTVKFWDTSVAGLDAINSFVTPDSCGFSPDGKTIFVCFRANKFGGIALWDADSAKPLGFVPNQVVGNTKRNFSGLSFAPDNQTLLTIAFGNAGRAGGQLAPTQNFDPTGRPQMVGGDIVGGESQLSHWNLKTLREPK